MHRISHERMIALSRVTSLTTAALFYTVYLHMSPRLMIRDSRQASKETFPWRRMTFAHMRDAGHHGKWEASSTESLPHGRLRTFLNGSGSDR